MSEALDSLVRLLDVERTDDLTFRGSSRDIGSRRVYGGQVLAQALVAARRTVEGEREAHSLHGYFILPGDLATPILYRVVKLRDGRSFTTRQVTAAQDGTAIFAMAASFQVEEEGPEHQAEMPPAPPPEAVRDDLERIRAQADRYPPGQRAVLTRPRPVEFRPVEVADPFAPQPRPPHRRVWIRATGSLPDEPLLHQAVLAYASDYGLLATALLPHALSFQQPRLQAATLDHAMWFHRRFRADEWLLYVTDSPAAAGARSFTRGSFYTRDGVLVASVAQEGLTRLREG